MEEKDKDVKKAISWALREISKKQEKAVFEFLQNYAKTNNIHTKQIIKEGMKKLSLEKQKRLKDILNFYI
jgi:3-methyladenine DNA glycosylase AlkD